MDVETISTLSEGESYRSAGQRRFAPAKSKIGQARQTREAVKLTLSHNNPKRVGPVALPIDYENFCTKNRTAIDNDPLRELAVFPRDDIQALEMSQEERTVESIWSVIDGTAAWHLPRVCLNLYSRPHKLLVFNYGKYGGDYGKINNASDQLAELNYEFDLIEDEANAEKHIPETRILMEGYLLAVPDGSNFIDNIRSGKRRYAYVRHSTVDDSLEMTLHKDKHAPVHSSVIIQQILQRAGRKGKDLIEVIPVGGSAESHPKRNQQTLVFAVDNETDLRKWLELVDNAKLEAAQQPKHNDDTLSVGSGTTNSSETTVNSDDSATQQWQGRAAGKALQPSPVARMDLFQLYSDLEPLLSVSTTSTGTSCLLQPVSPNRTRSLKPSPRVNFVLGCRQISIRIPLSNDSLEQVEPFFMRMYLVDARSGQRMSEEVHVTKDCLAHMWRKQIKEPAGTQPVTSEQRMVEWICHTNRQAMFTVSKPSNDLFVMVRIERVLQPHSVDAYLKPDVRSSHKVQKNATLACQRLGQYRMAFAWTAKPVFQEFMTGVNEKLALYKCDPDKSATDVDVMKFIADLSRPDAKAIKHPVLPGCFVDLHVDLSCRSDNLTTRLSSTYLRVKPFTAEADSACDVAPVSPSPSASSSPQPPPPVILESRVFPLEAGDTLDESREAVEPHNQYVNELFVYPMHLRYDTQRSFSKARNIVCHVRLMLAEDVNSPAQPCISWRLSGSSAGSITSQRTVLNNVLADQLLTDVEHCAVTHHSQTPTFNEEIKLHLPVNLTSRHYLLFTFGHVAVNAAMTSATPPATQEIEHPCGYAWLPLVKGDRLFMDYDLQEFSLPVSAEAFDQYPSPHMLAIDRNGASPDMKFVDNGRPLFRVRVRVVSSVFTTDIKLQRFFQSCLNVHRSLSVVSPDGDHHKRMSLSSSASMVGSVNTSFGDVITDNKTEEDVRRAAVNVQSVAPHRLLPFLPAVLTQLLQLLPQAQSEQLAVAALSTLINVVDLAHNCGQEAALRDFVRLQYDRDAAGDPLAPGVHESLCKLLPLLLRPAHADQTTITALLKHSWFFLEITSKSMGLHLLLTGMYKASRTERFPAELLFRLDSLVQSIVPLLVAHQHTYPLECRLANTALAYFFRVCLSLLDRGTVLKLIYYYMERMDKCDHQAFRDYKLDMLMILSQHEHWLPLCLPMICNNAHVLYRKQGRSSMPDVDHQMNGTMSSGKQDHDSSVDGHGKESISAGFWQRFMQSVFGASARGKRNCCTHDEELFDELHLTAGYSSRHFLSAILLQEVKCSFSELHEHRKRALHVLRNLLAKHNSDPRYVDERCKSRIASLYVPLLHILLDCTSELVAVRSVTTSALNTLTANQQPPASLHNTVSSRMSVDTHITNTTNNTITESAVQPTKAGSITERSVASTVQSSGTVVVGGNERLTVTECRDLLLVALHLLRHAPESHLSTLWHQAITQQLHNWCTLFELCVDMFAYRGRRATIVKTSARLRSSRGHLHQLRSTTGSQAQSHRLSLSLKDHGMTSSNTASTIDESVSQRAYSPTSPSSTVIGAPGTSTTADGTDGDDHWSIRTVTAANASGTNVPYSVLQECHLAEQASLTILDVLSQFTSHCKNRLESELDECQHLLQRVLSLYLNLLSIRSSQSVRLHTCAAVAMFVKKYERQLFVSGQSSGAINQRQSAMLSMLCSTLLSQLSSKIVHIQRAAAALIQVLLRTSYEFAGRQNWLGQLGTGMSVALAHLLSNTNQEHSTTSATDSLQLQRGLALLYNLANSNRHTSHFDQLVMELVSQLRDILSCTGALRDAEHHPYRLCELHVRLADSFRACAPLRQAWLEALAAQHEQTNQFSEAAICHLHIAAIMAKQLQMQGLHDVNWRLLAVLSENVVLEERDACGAQSQQQLQPVSYSLSEYCARVEHVAKLLVKAGRQEGLGPLYRLILPLYEIKREYLALSEAYQVLHESYKYSAETADSDRRSLGTYFRVIFYGQVFFGEEHGREWVYKLPGHTSLAEAAERIRQLAINHIGHERIEFCPGDDTQLSTATLDDTKAYIQISHVEPLVDDQNKTLDGTVSGSEIVNHCAPDQYELHTNVKRFFFECKMLAADVAPPESDRDGTFNHQLNEITRLGKRRIILTSWSLTAYHSFPYMLGRLSVVSRGEQQFSPLAVAIEQLRFKNTQLRRTLSHKPLVDCKRLQLQLQGCVQTTVNAGPLVYAEAFSDEKQRQIYGEQSYVQLGEAFRDLMNTCSEALTVNAQLISADQIEYHRLLVNSHTTLLHRLTDIFTLKVMNPAAAADQEAAKQRQEAPKVPPKRVSHVFNSISAVER